MQFTWDITSTYLSYSRSTPPVFVGGNTAAPIVLTLTEQGSPYIAPAGFEVLFAIRNPSDFSGPALAQAEAFAAIYPFGTYTDNLNLATDEMVEFLGNSPQGEALLQVTLILGDDTRSTGAIPVIVQNYSANPGTDPPTPV